MVSGFSMSVCTNSYVFVVESKLDRLMLSCGGDSNCVTNASLRHGVQTWDGGERICQALFMKDAVHDRLEQSRPEWVCHNDYINLTS